MRLEKQTSGTYYRKLERQGFSNREQILMYEDRETQD